MARIKVQFRGLAGLLAEWAVLFLLGVAVTPGSGLGVAATYAVAATLVGVVGREVLREWTGRSLAGFGPWASLVAAAVEAGVLAVLAFSATDAGVLLWFLVSLGLAGLFSWAAYRVGTLTVDGAAAAAGIGGFALGFGGWVWALVLVTFFVTSSLLSSWMTERKKPVAADFAKTGRRDAWQVLANGGVAALLAAFAFAHPDEAGLAAVGFLGALAAATADTWGTEVGVLSRRKPVLITAFPWRAVEAGTSGAVSTLGSLAAALGSLLIGLVGAFGFWVEGLWLGEAGSGTFNTAVVLATFVGGFAGSVADSVLGATVQARYWCAACEKHTERRTHHCGGQTRFSGGIAWIGNDIVNLMATVVGAGVAAALYGGLLINI